MKWTPYDKNQVTNLVVALKKARFELVGMEVMAFADVFKWVSSLSDQIEEELKPKLPIVLNQSSVGEQKTLDQEIKEKRKKTKNNGP